MSIGKERAQRERAQLSLRLVYGNGGEVFTLGSPSFLPPEPPQSPSGGLILREPFLVFPNRDYLLRAA
jgi:hypothetical protein